MRDESMKEIGASVSAEIHRDARSILEGGLCGIPDPCLSFDLGMVDYRVDHIDVRLRGIVDGITGLALDALLPKVEQLVEARVREKIRRSI